jgi:seryl-tRNA synthetase
MYDIKWIREHPEDFDRGLTRRSNLTDEERRRFSSANLISVDERRRAIIRVLESWQATRNSASKEIGQAKAKKDETKVQELMQKVAEAKESIPRLEREQKDVEKELHDILAQIPNTPAADVPEGKDEHGNVERHVVGKKRDYKFTPKQHFELGEALGMMDFELAAKLSGARFVVLQKGLARLERALGQLFLDVHTSEKHGYTEVNPPLLVRDEVMFGTAQLPKFRNDQFSTSKPLDIEDIKPLIKEIREDFAASINSKVGAIRHTPETEAAFLEYAEKRLGAWLGQKLDLSEGAPNILLEKEIPLWLIPTAEVPLTNLVRESIVDEDSLPRRYTACTPCFRAEAGAAGKDTRGMIRQHQFTKVELVSIVTPEKSEEEHERMLACAEEVLKKLDLHYRVVTLCTGDMGFAAQKTYDIEVWLPGQNMYREISSCSNCGEFQARRMNARYRGKDNKPAYVHTLNGSGVAVGRALIAVMETYQDEQGAIVVPEALKPYMGGITKIEKAK